MTSPAATRVLASRISRATSTRLKIDLRREVDGKCPIRYCQSTTIELAHITPSKKGGGNDFGNLIYLCPNHHREFDTGDFPEREIRLTKARLAWTLKRYTRAEYILLWVFSENTSTHFLYASSARDSLRSLESDGYIKMMDAGSEDSEESMDTWCLTEIGSRLVNVWRDSGAAPMHIK
ncbi:HNH endonuclease signature motif containing protein [Streptomyces sp. NPDC002643]